MNWFEKQLRLKEQFDNENFENSIDSIAAAVMGKRLRDALHENEIADTAINQILKYYHCKAKKEEIPADIKTVDEQIEYRMRPFGIKNRTVTLEKGWYHDAIGPMLGTLKEDGSAVAIIPGKLFGYYIVDIANTKRIKLNKKTEKLLDKEALCFYEPLPQKSLKVRDLLKFMAMQLSLSDIILFFVMMAASSALGLLSPLFTKWLFGEVLESGKLHVLISLAVFMISYSISQLCFGAFHSFLNSRIAQKQKVSVQAALVNRVISLPSSFFKKYSSGELAQRASYVLKLCTDLFQSIGVTGLTSIFSLIYIAEIFAFAPALVVPSLLIILVTLIVSLTTTFVQMRVTREQMEAASKLSGLTYSTITGIQKVKLAGAEKRMFSRWAKNYSEEARLLYNPPLFLKLSKAINLGISLFGTLILYYAATVSGVSVANYYAFNTSYGMVSAAFMSVNAIAVVFANIKPTLEMSKPIMETEPEKHDGKENITALQGGIELSHVSFRYEESMPYVIDNLSLKIEPGEYLAIVGPTGCGKSTLMRLLLGFEIPQKGSIFYDKKDINKIDLESLRKKIGTVIQDGKLFLADIYSNIIITAPQLTLDEAWEAAKIASIDEDIRNMPMGMHTFISEGQGGISGGQKQRLMIARAVAPKPKILMFDEATSALDNITQKNVSDAIDKMNCTRIVIAHRLSTIQHANRIVYLDGGKIVEEGTYDELIAKNGLFAELVERQRLDV